MHWHLRVICETALARNLTDSISTLLSRFLTRNDFSANTRRACAHDIHSFAIWFAQAIKEPFAIGCITTADITGVTHLFTNKQSKSISTLNKALVSLRRLFPWLVEEGLLAVNPCKKVKEIRRPAWAPKGSDHIYFRKLLRDVELRGDVRANALFHLMLYTGCRVGDLELDMEPSPCQNVPGPSSSDMAKGRSKGRSRYRSQPGGP